MDWVPSLGQRLKKMDRPLPADLEEFSKFEAPLPELQAMCMNALTHHA